MDETAGTVARDSSGNGNHLTLMGSARFGPGHSGNGLVLDASLGWASVPSSPSIRWPTSGVTLSAWIDPANVAQRHEIIRLGQSYDLWIYDGHLRITTVGGGVNDLTACPDDLLAAGSGWHHVAGVNDGVVLTVYLDGNWVCSNPMTGGLGSYSTADTLCVGKDCQYNGSSFEGTVDDVRIYAAAATAADICADAGRAPGTCTAPPVLAAPFAFARFGAPPPALRVVPSSHLSSSVDVELQWSTDPSFATASGATLVGVSTGMAASYLLAAAELPAGAATVHWRARSAPSGSTVWTPYAAQSFRIDPAQPGTAWQQTTEAQFREGAPGDLDRTSTRAGEDGEVVLGFNTPAVFSDDFESGALAAWTVVNANGTTRTATAANAVLPPSGMYALRLTDTDGTPTAPEAMCGFGSALGSGAVEWWQQTSEDGALVELLSARGAGPVLTWRAGQVQRLTSGATVPFSPAIPYAAGAWTHYRLEYTDGATYDLYVNRERRATGVPMTGAPDRFRASDDGQASTSLTGLLQDDVRVSAGATLGTFASPAIRASDVPGGWRRLDWSASGEGLTVQVETQVGPAWELVPDADLPGNAAGLASSPVSLEGLSAASHPMLSLKATLRRPGPTDPSPRLQSWTVTGVLLQITSELSARAECGAPFHLSPTVEGTGPFVWSVAGAPEGLVMDAASGALTWTPRADQAGLHTLELVVANAGGEDRRPVSIEVTCAPPRALALGCDCNEAPAVPVILLAVAWLGRLGRARRPRGNQV